MTEANLPIKLFIHDLMNAAKAVNPENKTVCVFDLYHLIEHRGVGKKP